MPVTLPRGRAQALNETATTGSIPLPVMTMEWFGSQTWPLRSRLSLLLPRRVALGEGELPDRYAIRGILAGYSKAQVYPLPAPVLSLIV
jgi:hypothetical protein